MRIPDYTARFKEPVICVKPGRTLPLKLCVALLALVGVPAVGVLIWAEVSGFNLNHLPILPRLALAAVAVACAWGIYSSVREAEAEVLLACYKDRLTLTWAERPSLWTAGERSVEIEVRYEDVKQCVYSVQRQRLTLDARTYRRREGEGAAVTKHGVVKLSTLGASGTDFGSLLEKHTPLRVLRKN